MVMEKSITSTPSNIFVNKNNRVEIIEDGIEKRTKVIHYSGCFKNGGPHGPKCQLRFSNDKVWYEGEIKEGWFDGYGKDFYLDGPLRYEGMYKNGGPHGENLTIYGCAGFSCGWIGNMIEGRRDGVGKEVDVNGNEQRVVRCENDLVVEVICGDDNDTFAENGGRYYGYRVKSDQVDDL